MSQVSQHGSQSQVFVEYTVSASIVLSNDNEERQSDSFMAYPNPADAQLWLQIPRGVGQVQVFRPDGQLFQTRQISALSRADQSVFWDVSTWSSGIYLIWTIQGQMLQSIRVQIK